MGAQAEDVLACLTLTEEQETVARDVCHNSVGWAALTRLLG